MKEFKAEFSKPILDLIPQELAPDALDELFEWTDEKVHKTGLIMRLDLEDCFERYTPVNEQIVKDIVEKGTGASEKEIIEIVKNVPNLKQLKGKVMQNPFLLTLTNPPISMSRLDAKFISALFKDPLSE